MSFPRYPRYKDSGLEWLGEVPEHWTTWKLFQAFGSIGSGTTPPSNEHHWYEEGTIPWVTTGELRENVITETGKSVTAEALKQFSTLRLHPAGSLVVAMYGATIGRLGILGVEATTNQACCVLSSPLHLYVRFLFYWIVGFKQKLIDLYAIGGGQPNINQDIISRLRVPAPSIQDQATIAAFLDRETAKIDALIAEQERLIALLAEKRQAVISHAVTKGLNPHAPMKPSGVEWLGEVPEHWGVSRLVMITEKIQTGPFGSQLHAEDYVENETPVINPSNIQNGTIIADFACTVGYEILERLDHHRVRRGDIIFGRRGEMGRCALVSGNEDGWLCGTGSLTIRLLNHIEPEYIVNHLSTPFVRELLKLESVGSTMDNLNTDILGQVPVALPPTSEQINIVNHIEDQTAKLDTLTTEARRAIALLQERRSALISAAVTGKIDVRGLADKESHDWHGEVLSKRRAIIDSGKATFVSLDNLKAQAHP